MEVGSYFTKYSRVEDVRSTISDGPPFDKGYNIFI